MDNLIAAALHAAAEYRFWISALLLVAMLAAVVLLPPQRRWRVSMAVLALLVLANQFLGQRLTDALQARHGNAGPATVVDETERHYNGSGNDDSSTGAAAGSSTAGSPRQVETAR